MWQRVIAIVFACTLLATQGCGKKAALAPDSLTATQTAAGHHAPALDRSSATSAEEVRGKIGPVTEYAFFLPENWNGDLVLYTHGYIPIVFPVGIQATEALGEHLPELRDLLLERGYAVGYSSYSANGFSVNEGALATNQLRGIFASKFGTPGRTFLIGQSLGSLSAVMLAERYPEHYAGVLSVAGALGGSRAAIDYYGHIRVLFEVFYPGVLPGSLLNLPATVDVNQDVVVPAVAAMTEHPEGAFAISQIVQAPVPFRSGPELVTSIAAALGFHAIALRDLLGRTHGHSFFDNKETVYSSASLPTEVLAFVNGTVARHSIAPDARAYLDRYYEPTGHLSIPMLTMHMQWDPIVPIVHETLYHDRVASAGRLDLLEQRTIQGYGHPSVPPLGEEILAPAIAGAFDDLVANAAAATKVEGPLSAKGLAFRP